MQSFHSTGSKRPHSRRLITVALGALSMVAIPLVARAHGFQPTRADPPLPFEVFVGGAVAVLIITYVGITRTWHTPRWQTMGDPQVWRSVPGLFVLTRLLGLVSLAIVIGGIASGPAGVPLSTLLVWIIFWLALPFAEVLVGNA